MFFDAWTGQIILAKYNFFEQYQWEANPIYLKLILSLIFIGWWKHDKLGQLATRINKQERRQGVSSVQMSFLGPSLRNELDLPKF